MTRSALTTINIAIVAANAIHVLAIHAQVHLKKSTIPRLRVQLEVV